MKIVCDAICKSFIVGKQPRTRVIDHCGAQFESGRITAIVGVSGVGKTTLLDILALSSIPDSGKVLYDGADSSCFKPRERAVFRRDIIGYLPQDLGLIPILTAEENIRLPLLIAGREDRSDSILVRKKDPLGIRDCLGNFPHELSGGQCQRIAIMRALANEPKIFIADEPTSHLDSENIERFILLLSQLKEQGITIIIATHDNRISDAADELLYMKDGRIEKKQTGKCN